MFTWMAWHNVSADIACNDESFTKSMSGGFVSEKPFIRLNKTPANYPAFGKVTSLPDRGALPKPFYVYTARFSNALKWRGKVCARQVAGYSTNNPYALQVIFEKKDSLGSWYPLTGSNGKLSSWYVPFNKTYVYSWYVNSDKPGDYRIRIIGAEANDQFDIMMDEQEYTKRLASCLDLQKQGFRIHCGWWYRIDIRLNIE